MQEACQAFRRKSILLGLSLTALLPAAAWYFVFSVYRFLPPQGQKTIHRGLSLPDKRKSYLYQAFLTDKCLQIGYTRYYISICVLNHGGTTPLLCRLDGKLRPFAVHPKLYLTAISTVF